MYTELNAVSKGTSLGIFTKDDDRGVEAAKDGSQPYIELMGRRWANTVLTTTQHIELTPFIHLTECKYKYLNQITSI